MHDRDKKVVFLCHSNVSLEANLMRKTIEGKNGDKKRGCLGLERVQACDITNL